MNYKGIPRTLVYGLLILACLLPLIFGLRIASRVEDAAESSVKFYDAVNGLKEGDVVLLASDWTGSTRGESKAHFSSIVHLLMRKGVKFAMYSMADPQAPRAASDAIRELAAEHERKTGKKFEKFYDWISLGFFPNAEVALRGMSDNFKQTVESRRTVEPGKANPISVLEVPFMKGRNKVSDFKMIIIVTASKTSNFTVERMQGKIPLAMAVTGVMVPETEVFLGSKQIVGFVGGLKGAQDLELLLERDYKGAQDRKQGQQYYPTLHVAVGLMIFLVILGNVENALRNKGVIK